MSGGSGGKRLRINTLERSVSTDYNRGWAFNAAHLSDALHYLFSGTGGNVDRGGGSEVLTSVLGPIGTPLEAVVFGGLMVTASVGANQLGVTPGAALLVDPDGLTGSSEATDQSADDAVAKLVVDNSGILAGSGTLVLTSNTSGSIRVDVVECRRKPGIIETSSRDIFDEDTGAFDPALVTKVDGAKSFEFRIRLGTPGSGFPGSVQGWLPLCVIGVPNGATTFDLCTLYDVRPLATDRVTQKVQSYGDAPRWGQLDCDLKTVSTERRHFGSVSTWVNGYLAGGKFSTVVSGVDVDFIDTGFNQTTA